MPAARCSICGLNFPIDQTGNPCPVCEADTLDGIQNEIPDPPADLERAVNRAEFERSYGPADVEAYEATLGPQGAM